MGLGGNWHADFLAALDRLALTPVQLKTASVIEIANKQLAFNLLDPETANMPEVIKMTAFYNAQGIQLIHVWRDMWVFRQQQVMNRLQSLAGTNKRIHGRSCSMRTISKKEADQFLDDFHLQGTTKAKYRLALVNGNDIIAVATFNMRPMPGKGNDYRSAEMLRFCNAAGITVVGGMSKLIKYFIALYAPHDMMTYADKDWSDGKSYFKSGFELINETAPLTFWLSPDGIRYSIHRLPAALMADVTSQPDTLLEDFLLQQGFMKVFNTGNKKFIKILKHGS